MQNRLCFGVLCLLLALGLACQSTAPREVTLPSAPVVLISIDGLKPDYVLEADRHGLKIPHLRRLLQEGAHATGVAGVLPTVTYPSHTTMVTGAAPATHGIWANTPFDPLGKNQSGWNWYAEDIKVPTLWDAAAQAGMTTASVDWPVTVGANITYNIVQYWRAQTPDDLKVIRALSTPGLLAEAERKLGPYPDGNDYTVAADRRRAAFNVYLLETRRPRLLTTYFSGLDTVAHETGPYSRAVWAALEEIDALVGEVRAAAEKIGGGRAVICVVSDHGFLRTDKELRLNAALREAGLIEVDEQGKVKAWRAYAWYAGGSAAIMLREAADDEARGKVRELLRRLAADPQSGLAGVREGAEAQAMRGFPGAAFVANARRDVRLGTSLEGPVTQPGKVSGTHGYWPEYEEMDAAFFLAGPGVPAGRALGRIEMRDIAPTLAGLLQVALPSAEGRDLLKDEGAAR
jgi:predicted AlkP superfamily pyrophosphatase or phosphodiesterase